MENPKKKIEYNYYWNHHLSVPFEERQTINECILEHNWNSFINYINKYPPFFVMYKDKEGTEKIEEISYFPMEIFIGDTEETVSIFVKENFDKITFTECECG